MRAPGLHGAPGALLNDPEASVLKMRSGTFELRPGGPVSIGGDSGHLLVQLERPLDGDVREELSRLGIAVLDHVPNRAFVLRVPRHSFEGLVRMPAVRAVGNLYPEDKLTPELLAGRIPARIARRGGAAEVRVGFFEGTPLERALQALDAVGGRPLASGYGMNHALRAEVPIGVVSALAMADEVRHVEEAAPPIAATNVRGASRSNAGSAALAPFGFNGSSVDVGVWDDGRVLASHPDFGGRVTVRESDNDVETHSTHVAATIGGAGLASRGAQGVATGVDLYSYDFLGEPIQEMRDEAPFLGLEISNSSWGHSLGFLCDVGECTEASTSSDEARFGLYSGGAADFDHMVLETGLVAVKSVGNDRNDGRNTTSSEVHDGVLVDGEFYDTIEDNACAKNLFSIGAVKDDLSMTEFSSFGPVDDGRVKPDLVAVGHLVLSASDDGGYAVLSGTSMSTPMAAGQLALFLDAHMQLAGSFPRVSRVKAVAINSAGDLQGTTHAHEGPDYSTGWGLTNVQRMLALAETELQSPFTMQTLAGSFSSTGETTSLSFIVPKSLQELKVTVAWTDPVGSPIAGPALVNDLDLRLMGPDGFIWKPWVLDPANPSTAATRGNNAVDNVEQVAVTQSEAVGASRSWFGTWRLFVRSRAINQGPQTWDLAANVALSGQPSGSAPEISIESPTSTTSGRPVVAATVTPDTGRSIVAVDYRVGNGPWLAMALNVSTGRHESIVNIVNGGDTTEDVVVRALDDAVRETRATTSVTFGSEDDHPDDAGSTTPADTLVVDGEAVQGVFDPITPSADIDAFQVDLTAGEVYTFEVIPDDGLLPQLSIFDTDSSTLLAETTEAADVDGSQVAAVRLIGFVPANTGTHFIELAPFGVFGTVLNRYDYTLRVWKTGVYPRISATPTSGNVNLSVTFTNHTTGSFTGLSWDFGDGETSTASAPSHTYSTGGTYSARLTVTTPSGTFQSNVVEIVASYDHPGSIGSATNPRDVVTPDGATLEDSISDLNQKDFYVLPAVAGNKYIIDVIPGTLGDPIVKLIDSDKATDLAENDDPNPKWSEGAHLVTTVFASTADRYLQIRGPLVNPGGTGTYFVRVVTYVSPADLKVTAVTAPASIVVSQVAEYTVTVENSGSGAAGAFDVGLFASVGETINIDQGDFELTRVRVLDGLASGATTTVTIPFAFEGSGTSFKAYAVADVANEIPEDSENDNALLRSTDVTINASDRPPQVTAGPELSVQTGSTASLSATAADPDTETLSYSWTQLFGPEFPDLSNAGTSSASFTPTKPGLYRFLVTVTESDGESATAPQDVYAWDVSGASLSVGTVGSALPTVGQGQQNIAVGFSYQNVGGGVAFIGTETLVFSQGAADVTSFFTVQLVSAGATYLQTGDQTTAAVLVTIDGDAPPGLTTVHGKVAGVDGETGDAISDQTAASPVTWDLQTAAAFSIGTPTLPAKATRGQSFVASFPVTNSGQAAAVSVTSTLAVSGAGVTVTPRTNPSALPGGGSGSFLFDVAVSAGAATGSRNFDFDISGQDVNTANAVSTSTGPLALEIESAPVLEIVSLTVSSTSASIGQALAATVTVRNSGGASIDFTAESLVATGSSVSFASETETFTLAGGGATVSFGFLLSADSSGVTTFTSATFTAFDANSGAAVPVASNGAAPVAVTVEPEPELVLQSLAAARTVITVGQSILVTATLRNDGSAAAEVTSAALTIEGSAVSAPDLPADFSLAGSGATTDLVFTLTGLSSGSATLTSATFAARDANSQRLAGLSSSEATSIGVTVQTAPFLRIDSIASARSIVSTGQTFAATVTVTNTGETGIVVTAAQIVPGNSKLTGGTVSIPGTVVVAGGQQAAFTGNFTAVSSGASSLATATFAATNANTGAAIGVGSNAASLVPITVQQKPRIHIDSIVASRNLVSTGESLTATLTLSNKGGATARLTSESLVFDGTNLSAPSLSQQVDLDNASPVEFTFTVTSNGTGVTSITSALIAATDLNSGSTVGVAANDATSVSVTVQSPPGLKILTITVADNVLSIGETTLATLTVGNDGADGVIVTAETLVIGGSSSVTAPSLTESVTLASQSQHDFTFTLTAESAGQSTIATADLTAEHVDFGTPIPIKSNHAAASPVTVTVQSPPELVIETITASRTTVSEGQSFLSTVRIRNDGEATAQITSATLVVSGGLTAGPSLTPSSLTGGASGSFTFNVTAGSAGAGSITSATLDAVDAGNSVAAPIVGNESAGADVTVQSPPSLSLEALEVTTATIQEGETLTATLSIDNAGQATAVVSALDLVFVDTRLSAPQLAGSFEIAGGGTRFFEFTVTGQSAGSSGISSALLAAVDANTGSPVAIDGSSLSTVAVTVQPVPVLKVTGLSADRTLVTTGQEVRITLQLRNDGSAAADFTQVSLTATGAGLTIPTSTATFSLAAGGATTSIVFIASADTSGRTTVAGAAVLATNSANGRAVSVSSTLVPPLTVTVQEKPELHIIGLSAVPASIAEGKSLAGKVEVKNFGEATVHLSQVVLLLSGGKLSAAPKTLDLDVAGGATKVLSVSVTAIQTGIGTIDGAVISGTDLNTGLALIDVPQDASAQPVEVLVKTPAKVKLVGLAASPSQVTKGQGLTVTVTYRNEGEDDARVRNPSLVFDGPAASAAPSQESKLLPGAIGGTGVTTSFTLAVSTHAEGRVRVTSAVAVIETAFDAEVLDLAANTASAQELTIQKVPVLNLTGLTASRNRVTVGQPFTMTLSFEHGGGAAVNTEQALLKHDTTRLTVPARSIVSTLQTTGESVSVTFDAVAGSSVGQVVVSTALVTARDANSGAPVAIGANRIPALFIDLQSPPALELTGLQASRTQATVGQTFHVTATLLNAGGATARLDGVSLAVSGARSTVTTPAGGFELGSSQSGRITFQVRADSAGTLTATTVVVQATDVNSGGAHGLKTNRVSAPLAVQAQSPPLLVLDEIRPSRSIVSIDDLFDVTLLVRNLGQASARVTTFSVLGASGVLKQGAMTGPVVVPGGGAGVSLPSTATAIATGTADLAEATVTYSDVNTGSTTTASLSLVASSRLTVLLRNNPPVAAIVSPGPVHVTDGFARTVSLTGTGSSDPDGSPLAYQWSVVSGPSSLLLEADRPTARIAVSSPGTVVVRLRVTDDRGATDQEDLALSVLANGSPIADAGPDLQVLKDLEVTLTGSATDPDGDPLSYLWSLRGAPETDLRSAGASVAFTPTAEGTLVLDLTVTDGKGGTAVDTVSIAVGEGVTWTMELNRGLTLISLPIRPLTSGTPMTLRGLMAAAGASFAVCAVDDDVGRSRFATVLPSHGADAPLEQGRGYLVRRPGPPVQVVLSGQEWQESMLVRKLSRGVQFLGLEVGGASPHKAEDLRALVDSPFLGRVVPDPAGLGRFELYVPGRTTPYDLRTGEGYLLAAPTAREVVIPGP